MRRSYRGLGFTYSARCSASPAAAFAQTLTAQQVVLQARMRSLTPLDCMYGQAIGLAPTQAHTSNRGGVATSSSQSEQHLPKLRTQPVRKHKDRRDTGIEQRAEFDQDSAVAWLEDRVKAAPIAHPPKQQSTPWKGVPGGKRVKDDPNVTYLAKKIASSKQGPAVTLEASEISNTELHRLLALLVAKRHADKAVQVLNWIVLQPKLQKERGLYFSNLMALLGRSSSFGAKRALLLHESMRAQGVPLDLVSYNIIISTTGKAGLWQQTQNIFQEMVEAGVKPDVVTYTSLMKACQACGNRWKQALIFLDQMRQEGVAPNVNTYTTIISCCQRSGRWEKAMSMFREMEEAGIQADVQAYNSVISSCARGGRWEHAWEVCSSMRRLGCQPNTRTYNALISACERARQPQRALEAYQKMKRDAGSGSKLKPTIVTFNTLINACAKSGMFDVAQELYEEMQRLDMKPDVITLSALITACKRLNYWEEAMDLVEEFATLHGVKLNTIACNGLITTLGRAGRWQYAQQYFDQLTAGELEGEPDSWTFAAMALACRSGEQYQRLMDIYYEMRRQNLPIYRDVYYSVLEACERLGLWQQGRETLLHMQEALAASARSGTGLDMAAWQAVFAFPPLMQSVPKPLISAARAAVDSGKYARRLVSARQRERPGSDSDDES